MSTLSNSKDMRTAHDTILGRVQALARAQEFFAAGPSGGAQIDEIIRTELAVFGGRISIDAHSVVTGSAFAQIFAFVVHELAQRDKIWSTLDAGRLRRHPMGRT